MLEGWFDRPVSVVIDRRGNITRSISSTTEAAEVLLNEWPTEPGKKHLAARNACLKVLEGLAESRQARAAFEAAAREANVLAPEVPMPSQLRRKPKRDM